MKFETIEEKTNPLMKRKEIILMLDYENKSTPSKAELQKFLADELKASIESLEISKILSEVGLAKGKVWVKIWNEKKVPIYSELKKEAKAEQPSQPVEQKAEEKSEQ